MPQLKFTPEQKRNRRRILEISYEKKLSHLGSCLSVIDIICCIYRIKRAKDRFVLSSGHAGMAWYVILEKYGLMNRKIINRLFIHPDRNLCSGICVSSGSLGHGLPIALGMALADKEKFIYCVISDGECAEGSIWEAIRVGHERQVDNLKIIINANGWGAYGAISMPLLLKRIKGFGYTVLSVNGHDMKELSSALRRRGHKKPLIIFARTDVEQFPFLKAQDAHYRVMKKEDYKNAMDSLI